MSLTEEQIKARFLFLLEKAGEHRACVLAEFVNIPTGQANAILGGLLREGSVRFEDRGATQYWSFVKRVCSDPT